eukprot:gene3719-3981_t
MPNSGPIAVQAVANLVAHEAATATPGGLLEGSHSVMMAVTRRGSDTSNTINNSLATSCDMSRTATGGEGHSRCSSVDTELKGAGAGTSSTSCPGSPGTAAAAAVTATCESSSRNNSPVRGTGQRQQESLAQTLSRKLSQTLRLGGSNGSSTGSTPTGAAAATMERSAQSQLSCLGPTFAISKGGTGSEGAAGGSSAVKGSPLSPSSASAGSSYFSSSSRQQHTQLGHQRHRHTGSGSMSVATATTPAGASVADGLSDVSSEDGEVAHDNFVAWMTSHEISTLDTDELSDYYPDQLPDWDDQVAGQQGAAAAAGGGGGGTTGDPAAAEQHITRGLTPPPTPDQAGRQAAVSSGVGGNGCAGGLAGGPSTALAGAADASLLVLQSHGADRASAAAGTGSGLIAAQPTLPPIKTGSVASGVTSGGARGAGSGAAAVAAAASGSSGGLQQKARVALPGRALMPAGINDTVVPIFDSEPTSIAAYFLSSRSYQLQVNAAMKQILHDDKQPDWLELLLSPEPFHVKQGFDDESPGMPWLRARFSVTAYFAPQFAELRRRCIVGGEAAYITSLSRFIVKSLSKPEKASFLEFAPAYFEHMAQTAASGRATTLAKVAGVYSISVRTQGGGTGLSSGQGQGGQAGPFKDGVIDVLVMENIFYDRQISRIYDLKGSERSRFNADAAANPQDAGAVHLDDNLRRSNLQAPILVDQCLLRSMERALWADTSFLSGLGVMDYSLLVGVDRESNQLVVAIIDFIRTYTWDKQLETWVKSSGILGGNGKEPTIISPKQYMRRFRAAISGYFTVVPDGHEVEAPLDPDAA